jgi:hypothetical protein
MTNTSTTTSSTITAKPFTVSWIKRQATNLFILSIIVLFTIDVAPFEILESIQADIDSFLDTTGLWQGPYYLFCPEVDKENIRLSARITYVAGNDTDTSKPKQFQIWQSPDWSAMSPLQKKRYFRQMEYYDCIRRDDYQVLWKPLAQHLVQKHIQKLLRREQSVPPIAQIELYRHWTTVHMPPETTGFWDKVELDYYQEGSYAFYTLEYS